MNKFRVWNLKDEVFENNILLSSENELYKIKNNKLIKVKRENYVVQYSIDIKDENGIEIYEGDIVEKSSMGKEFGYIAFWKFNMSFAFKSSLEYSGYSNLKGKLKIVGHIFKNSDILVNQDNEINKNYKGFIPQTTCLSQQYLNKKLKMFL